MRRVLLCCLLLFVTSCGYKFKENEHTKIGINFVDGDNSGILTAAIIEEISNTKGFTYARDSDAEIFLELKILEKSNSVIGYKHDRENDGTVKKTIMPIEGREKVVVQGSIVGSSGKILFGPFNVTQQEDYDYVEKDTLNDLSFIDGNGQRQTVLAFSLGQLEGIDSAQSAALKPLYRKLAQKIVDLLSARLEVQ